jgi:transcriptional regulator with XRE-family HTH domain
VLGEQVGMVLRRARRSRGWTLRRAADAAGGRFAATSIASYERGERAITVERFIELACLYQTRPDRLFAEAVRSVEGRSPVIVDRDKLSRPLGREASVLGIFVDEVARLRRVDSNILSIRGGDVQVLAAMSGRREDDFLERLSEALPDPPEPGDPAGSPRVPSYHR